MQETSVHAVLASSICSAKIMSYDEKIEAFRRVLKERGDKQGRFISPILPLLQKVGFHPIPPVFRTYRRNALTFGCTYCFAWYFIWGFLWLIGWRDENRGTLREIVVCVSTGTILSLLLSWMVARKKVQLSLGEWDSFGAQHEKGRAGPVTAAQRR
jgi:hypothetical protein